MKKVVLFAANRGYALLSSRRIIIERFLDCGWEVVLATSDDEESRILAGLGVCVEPVNFHRGGFAPLADFRAGRRLQQIIRRWKPSLVHFFHAKPVIMGAPIVRRELGADAYVVNTITGLGHAFIHGGLIAKIASIGYRRALPKADATIFQNKDDLSLFISRNWVSDSKSILIAGSGIAIDRFLFVDRSGRDCANPVVIMLGRLLNQKGVSEFLEVAKNVKQRIPGAKFFWAGEEDPIHPDSVETSCVRNRYGVEYLGRLSDVKPLLDEADLLLFPSYREGLPRAVMEAAASGLATVAFDVPGVREAVRHSQTGYLVPFRDVKAMTYRVLELLQNEAKRLELGRNANDLAKGSFDIRAIEGQYLRVYRGLGVDI